MYISSSLLSKKTLVTEESNHKFAIHILEHSIIVECGEICTLWLDDLVISFLDTTYLFGNMSACLNL